MGVDVVSSHENYMPVETKLVAEPVVSRMRNDGRETPERLARSGDWEVVPKPGFEPGHPCGR